MVPTLGLIARTFAAIPLALLATTCTATPAQPVLHHSTPTATASHQVTQHHLAQHHVVQGADISWPNCPRGEGIKHRHTKNEPMPEANARFVIVGLTNGPGFSPNPCLANQLRWVADHHRYLGGYALTTYPTVANIGVYGGDGPYPTTTARGRLRNAAYAEATYNVNSLARVGMSVPMIWVDVEPYPFWPWSHNRQANRAVISAVIRRYREAGHTVGIYTYANGWREVTGNWKLPTISTWSTAGMGSQRQAHRMCTRGPSRGPTWIAQWYTADQDFDLLCRNAPAKPTMFTAPPS